jgi:hypothetical protein
MNWKLTKAGPMNERMCRKRTHIMIVATPVSPKEKEKKYNQRKTSTQRQ